VDSGAHAIIWPQNFIAASPGAWTEVTELILCQLRHYPSMGLAAARPGGEVIAPTNGTLSFLKQLLLPRPLTGVAIFSARHAGIGRMCAVAAQRRRKGISLDAAAAGTKIQIRYLRALEAGDFGELPHVQIAVKLSF